METTEKNKRTLFKAIHKLPQYDPPADLWEGIATEWASYQADPVLSQSIGRLPEYTPDTDLWPRIEKGIAREPVALRKKIFRWAAAAAVFAGLLLASTFLNRSLPSESTITYSVSTELVDNALLDRTADQEDDTFTLIEHLCANQPFMCANPDIQTMQMELEELNEAKLALEDALSAYETDTYLVGQLIEIEMARTRVIKKILGAVI